VRPNQPTAEVYVPDGAPPETALARTTHLAIGAHPDDLEIMAVDGILHCYERHDRFFCGVVVTDGGGSPRDGAYAATTDAEMRANRRKEQQHAAQVGAFGALILLDYPSSAVKDPRNESPLADLVAVIEATCPEVIYAHNLADAHDTHVAVALRTIEACRRVRAEARPKRLFGCEVWRDLDWLTGADRVSFDLSARENLQAALVGVFDSQISGGKRYDLAALGRRRAHATFSASHATDATVMASLAIDLTPLIAPDGPTATELIRAALDHFSNDVLARLARLT
jgi:LmbE family N-acetylglucosaminyl deacetylase